MTLLKQPRSGSAADEILREYEATSPLDDNELTERARKVIKQDINKDSTRLDLEYQSDGRAKIRAKDYVGIVALPDGPTIEVRPKIQGTDLLGLLKYASGIEADTVEETTQLSAGRTFVDALATLFEAELSSVLAKGLHQDYRQKSEAVSHIRGRLDIQRQLQRQGPVPTKFECTYDELTVDTTVNRAVLYATVILQQLVQDRSLNKALRRHRQRLRRRVELVPVRSVELERIELTRLTKHYEDLFRLTKLVLENVYIEELRASDRSSFALLMYMPGIFEGVVEQAVDEVFASTDGWSVETQAKSNRLVSDGSRSISIRPDILVFDDGGREYLVGDAKWKLDDEDSREPSRSDISQIVSYQVAHETSGVLFYPEQNGRVESEYSVDNLDNFGKLSVVEIPTRSTEDQPLAEVIRNHVSEELID